LPKGTFSMSARAPDGQAHPNAITSPMTAATLRMATLLGIAPRGTRGQSAAGIVALRRRMARIFCPGSAARCARGYIACCQAATAPPKATCKGENPMSKRSGLVAALAALALVGLLAGSVRAEKKQLKPSQSWSGSIDDEKLAKEAPETGYVADAKAFK